MIRLLIYIQLFIAIIGVVSYQPSPQEWSLYFGAWFSFVFAFAFSSSVHLRRLSTYFAKLLTPTKRVKPSYEAVTAVFLLLNFFAIIFYLQQGHSLAFNLDTFATKTQTNATTGGAVVSRLVRYVIPPLYLYVISWNHSNRLIKSFAVAMATVIVLVSTNLTGFRGYFISFYLFPLLILGSPFISRRLSSLAASTVSLRISRKALLSLIFFLALFVSVFSIVVFNSAYQYGVSLFESVEIVVTRLTAANAEGSVLGLSLIGTEPVHGFSADVCNAFGKIFYLSASGCAYLPLGRYLAGSETSSLAVDVVVDSAYNYGLVLGPIFVGSIYGLSAKTLDSTFGKLALSRELSNSALSGLALLACLGASLASFATGSPSSIVLDSVPSLLIAYFLLLFVSNSRG